MVNMEYIEMTIEEALEFNKGNKNSKVLVAVSNFEADEVVAFVRKTRGECENIIKKAETVVRGCDEFIDLLKCYSDHQDIKAIRAVGDVTTILYSQHK